MKEIEIPFLLRFHEDIGNGQKVMTTRSRKYGDAGDYFWVKHAGMKTKCVLLAVFKMRLWHIAYQFYEAEGFNCPEDFVKVWNEIHPRKPYEEMKQANYWVHIFSPAFEWAEYKPEFEKETEK